MDVVLLPLGLIAGAVLFVGLLLWVANRFIIGPMIDEADPYDDGWDEADPQWKMPPPDVPVHAVGDREYRPDGTYDPFKRPERRRSFY